MFDGDVAFVTTAHGLFSVDIADPADPQLLGHLPYYIWENEDVDYDPERKLLSVSRDPRGFTGIIAPAQLRFFGAVEIFDVSDPSVFVPVNAFTPPAGHTTTCISAGEGPCDFTWTGGPYGNEAFGPYGRPIYATDIRQVGYFRPDGGGEAVAPGEASAVPTVTAPPLTAGGSPDRTSFDPTTGYTCRLPLGG